MPPAQVLPAVQRLHRLGHLATPQRFSAYTRDSTPCPLPADARRATFPGEPPLSADGRTDGLLLTPFTHGTDGFYVAVLQYQA